MDSCFASSMKPQVLMMTTSAFLGLSVNAKPSCTSVPSISSESTWFFEHPRLTKPMVVVLAAAVFVASAAFLAVFFRLSWIKGVDIQAVYGRLEKPVNECSRAQS
jgi:hypothetical protein